MMDVPARQGYENFGCMGGFFVLFWTVPGLILRLATISPYTLDLGWDDFVLEVTILGALVAFGSCLCIAGYLFGRRSARH